MSTTAYYGDIPISEFVEALANVYYQDVNTMCIDEVIQVIMAHETEDDSEEIAHIVRTTPNNIYVTALAKASSDLGPLSEVFRTGSFHFVEDVETNLWWNPVIDVYAVVGLDLSDVELESCPALAPEVLEEKILAKLCRKNPAVFDYRLHLVYAYPIALVSIGMPNP